MRTRQGLAAARAQGQQLGRRKGSRNKHRPLDPFREQICKYLELGLTIAAIRKLINPHLDQELTYNSYKHFIQHDKELSQVWQSE